MRHGIKVNQLFVPIKEVEYNNGVPRIKWTEEEVEKMNVIEELPLAVIGKKNYDWPELDDLRTQIPK